MSYSVDLKELLEAGCHFGHQARRWNPKMAPYIYTERDGVHIFDLGITAQKLAEAMEFVKEWVASGKEMVFVGTKRQAQAIVREEALAVGAPFISERWLGGTITNWDEIGKRLTKLKDMKVKREAGEYKKYTKKENVLIEKEIAKLERFLGGLVNLSHAPEALFVVDINKEEVAVREAKLRELPVVGVVDTNTDPIMVTKVIPANDDAVRAIKLVVSKIAFAYGEGKALRKATPSVLAASSAQSTTPTSSTKPAVKVESKKVGKKVNKK